MNNVWEPAIEEFEERDGHNPPKKDAILFTGSSSIGMWQTLESDFPSVAVLNRGFGGSQMEDLVLFADRIVVPYRPRQVVVYSGDNDLACEKTPEIVLENFIALVEKVHSSLPETPVGLISIKPSLARWPLIDAIRKANRLMREYIEGTRNLAYMDVFTPMLGSDGRPRAGLFCPDGLHLGAEGYRLWAEIVTPYLK